MTALYRDHCGQVVQVINPNWAKIANVTVGSPSAQSTVTVPHGCTLVMLISTTNCWFKSGANPTAAASATSIYLPGGVYFYLPVSEGDVVAFLQYSAAGTAQVIPAL